MMDSDVILVIGANPTDGHPVFASRMKQRLRARGQADRHRSAPDRYGPYARISRRQHHLPLRPGTNVAVLTAMAHVIVTEGLADEAFVRERCDWDEFQPLGRFCVRPAQCAETLEPVTMRARRRLARGRPAVRHGTAMARSITAWA